MLIDRYEVRYFTANRHALRQLAADPRVYPRLALETATYLGYRNDPDVADALAEMLTSPLSAMLGDTSAQLIQFALRANPHSTALATLAP
jgi:hypothetical protein